MQTKALLLAAAALAAPALAQSTATPINIDGRFLSKCTSAASSLMGAFEALPTPTGALSSYLHDAGETISDPCSWVAAAPTSLSSEVSVFSSRVSALVSANSAALSELATCASVVPGGEDAAAIITPFMRITDCKATPTGAATGAGASGSKNAAPAQTGVAAAAAAVALVGVAGLL